MRSWTALRTAGTAGLLALLVSAAMLPALAAPGARQPVVPTLGVDLTLTTSPTPIVIAPPPTITPFPTLPANFVLPSPSPGACSPPLPLYAGARIAFTPGVNLRNLPTISGALVNYYAFETVLTVGDGPVCANGYNWWYLSGDGPAGWAIEGRPGRYFMELLPPEGGQCGPALPLQAGGQASTSNGLRVHDQPALSGRVLTVAAIYTIVDVLEGPRCADNLNWWRIRAPFDGGFMVEGWAAESMPGGDVLLAPLNYTPAPTGGTCYRPLRLLPGDRAAVTYTDGVPRNLRAAPSGDAPVLHALIAGVAFDIVSGPACVGSMNWWQVRLVATGEFGWLAEGRPGNYIFDILYQQGR